MIQKPLYSPSDPLSTHLPPLVFGTATLNYQFNRDPYALHPNALVSHALQSGVRAFDTSPYYGPAESILGTALSIPSTKTAFPRNTYHILTKVGRIAGDIFDYSPEWIRHSIKRSLARLKTDYLDVVYCHDVEFVSPAEVLKAVEELRKIRNETGSVKYVGISGYPVKLLAELAEMVLRETGEPLDVVMSYANYTLQNTRLLSEGLQRLIVAGVDVVPNASPLSMGLLRSQGVPIGSMGNWHPAPDALREKCLDVAHWVEHEWQGNEEGEKLETVAVRFALESWAIEGRDVGTFAPALPDLPQSKSKSKSKTRIGVSVMGVSAISELSATMCVWREIVDSLFSQSPSSPSSSSQQSSPTASPSLLKLQSSVREIFGSYADFTWSSPDEGYVNQRKHFGVTWPEAEELKVLKEKNRLNAKAEQIAGIGERARQEGEEAERKESEAEDIERREMVHVLSNGLTASVVRLKGTDPEIEHVELQVESK